MWADFTETSKEWCSAPELPLVGKHTHTRPKRTKGNQKPGRAEGRGCGLCWGPRLGETHREGRHLMLQTPVSSLPTGQAPGKPRAGSILGHRAGTSGGGICRERVCSVGIELM